MRARRVESASKKKPAKARLTDAELRAAGCYIVGGFVKSKDGRIVLRPFSKAEIAAHSWTGKKPVEVKTLTAAEVEGINRSLAGGDVGGTA